MGLGSFHHFPDGDFPDVQPGATVNEDGGLKATDVVFTTENNIGFTT